jgi:uncharacterized protein (TIGR02687 family)
MELSGKINQLFLDHQLVFYFDEDGAFQEELAAIAECGIKVLEVKDNYFQVKFQLNSDLKDERVFIYHPFARPSNAELKKYPLLDLLKANTELRLDDASELMTEFALPQSQQGLVKRYIKQLKTKTNQRKLANILDPEHFTESNLYRGLISIVLGFNKVESRNVCIAKWLTLALDKQAFEKANDQLSALELDRELAKWLSQLMAKRIEVLHLETAVECAQRVKYNTMTTHISKAAKEDSYAPKLKLSRAAEINHVQAFMNDWLDHAQLKDEVETVFAQLARDIDATKVVSWYGIEQEYGYYTEAMYRQTVAGIYTLATTEPEKAKEECIRWRKTDDFASSLRSQVDFLYHYVSVIMQLGEIKSYRLNTTEEYIDAYAKEWFKIDKHFRKALIAYESAHEHFGEFESKAAELFETLNQKYDRHLIGLNKEWQTLLQEKAFDFGSININKQYNFYQNEIESFEHKIAVIISDAFRYELGHELYEELLADSKNQLTVEPYICSIPSYTNLGMSNLLPNKAITVKQGDKDLVFSIDDQHTVSSNREQILQTAIPDSAVVSAKKVLETTKLEEGRALFRPKVVYVYHDWIDAIGDKKGTEHATFEATEKALDEIKRLIRKISAWNVKNVLITADHGFLYNHKELQENQREIPPEMVGYNITKARFVVAEQFKGKVDGYTMDMRNTTNLETDLKVALPRAINRYRVQGNVGFQFSHGGGSLQELIIPVIKYYKHVKEVAKQVTFRRIDQANEIRSGSVKISILQDMPVSNEYKSRDVVLGLYSDDFELLSNEAEVTLNSTSMNPRERVYEAILTLTSKGTSAAYCHLRAYNKEDTKRLNPIAINDVLTITSLMEKDEW